MPWIRFAVECFGWIVVLSAGLAAAVWLSIECFDSVFKNGKVWWEFLSYVRFKSTHQRTGAWKEIVERAEDWQERAEEQRTQPTTTEPKQ